MIINMGPQHPSTHGVLRIMMELEGETVLRSKPVIGYLHTGMEKTGEELTYVQGATNVTRMDYLSPLHNELVFSLAAEALLGIEIPPRATWIRMLMTELNRISSHVLWMATNGMDLASTSMMIYGFRDREMILSFFEKTTGLRMNHDYIRPGGVAADLPDGWEDDVMSIVETIPGRVDEYNEILTGQPIFKHRTEGVGVISPDLAIALAATGPILRASGVAWDLRRDMPYLAYDEVDFDVIVGTVGDTFDRYAVRLNEIRESLQDRAPVCREDASRGLPDSGQEGDAAAAQRIDESMEALIRHFKIFTRGFEIPPGEVVHGHRVPHGELGCYLVADGSNKPYRMHIRAPSFVNLQTPAAASSRRADRGRRRRHLLGGPGHGRGGSLMAHLSPDNRARAEALVACYPRRRSALIPLCHLAQAQDGWLSEEAMEDIAELLGCTPAEVRGTATFYDMLHTEPVGRHVVTVCTNIACMLAGAYEVLDHAEASLGISVGQTTADGEFTLEEAECLAGCDNAPCVQVNHRFFGPLDTEGFDALIEDLARAASATPCLPTGH